MLRRVTPVLLPLTAALVAMLPGPAEGQTRGSPPGWDDLGRHFDAYAKGERIVGGSAVLVREGTVVARHDYGLADRATGRRVDEGTIYHWGSVTKTLTAIAILQLRDRGRLSLDDPVTRWVPELRRVHDPYGSMDRVTIAMLLSHSSGLQDPTWPWTEGEPWQPFEPTAWEQLVAMMPYQQLRFAPGSRFGYSNPGFIYLARIIEAISGDPWAVYIQKNLWTPLRLTHSYVGLTPYHLAARRGHGYEIRDLPGGRDSVVDLGADFDPGITIPNGGWNAPTGDLATYLGFLSGAPGDSTVLSRRTLEEMWRPRVETGAALPAFASVGLGFFTTTVDGRRVVGHTGTQAGYRSFVYLNPERKTGIILVFNTTPDTERRGSDLAHLAREAIGLLAR